MIRAAAQDYDTAVRAGIIEGTLANRELARLEAQIGR
jgi:hypothetical protein